MQSSNEGSTWSALSENQSAKPEESIRAGILWLYWKGVTVRNLTWENGKIVSGDVTWTGGDDWMTALKRYNGGGDVNSMEKVNNINNITAALEEGKSVAYKKQEDDQKKKKKKGNEKKKKDNDDG